MPTPEKKAEQSNKLNFFLNQREKNIRWVIFIAVLILGYFLLLQPKISQLREAGIAQLPAKSSELELLNKYSQKLKELAAKVSGFQTKYSQEVSDLNQVLPAQAQIPELIAELDALVQKSGFRINSLDINETSPKTPAKKIPENSDGASGLAENPTEQLNNNLENLHLLEVTLSVSGGDYPAFKVLLNKIEKNIRLLDLISIKFSAVDNNEAYSLILRTYYFSSPKL